MAFEFNLVDAAWIPCIPLSGGSVELSLRETLLRAHDMREIGGESPLVTAALYRLLLAVAHRVYGPAGYDAWGELWDARRFPPGPLNDYLDEWRDRFDLFHPEHPFYQYNDERVKEKPVISLVQDMASGNNATLFDHHCEQDRYGLSPAQAARALVCSQAFALGGGKSGIPQNFSDAPCARGIVFVALGGNLFETCLLNQPPYPSDWPMPTQKTDSPVWERDSPFDRTSSVPHGYLDYLTWPARRILLIPTQTAAGVEVAQVKLTQGRRLGSDVYDPMKLHLPSGNKKGLRPLVFREDRALWRDSAALVQVHGEGKYPPLCIKWISEVGYVWDEDHTYQLSAYGMATDPGRAAKVEFFRGERLPVHTGYLHEPSLVAQLHDALAMSESVSGKLWGASRHMATLALRASSDKEGIQEPDPKDIDNLQRHWAIGRRYWVGLELPFLQLMISLPKQEGDALLVWRDVLRDTARDALREVSKELARDPHSMKASVMAHDRLEYGLAEALSVAV